MQSGSSSACAVNRSLARPATSKAPRRSAAPQVVAATWPKSEPDISGDPVRDDGKGARWALVIAVAFGVAFYCILAGAVLHVVILSGIGLAAAAACALAFLLPPPK